MKARKVAHTAASREAASKEVLHRATALAKRGKLNHDSLTKIKRKASKRQGLSQVVKNAELFELAKQTGAGTEGLRVRKVRSLSGVSVIAIMTKPAGCPGKCIYCPGGVTSPKSYTGHEPASMRAAQNNFDARLQVESRLRQLESIGHKPQKCDVIVMGGTFNSFPAEYQIQFVKKAFEGFNGRESISLEEAQKFNETADKRVIGVTFETRPDWCTPKDVEWLVKLGSTRVELGVQTLSDEVYKKIQRGHTVQDVVDATKNCKDAFLKVCYHYMPGLFSTPDEDVAMFKKVFADSRFKPDMIKIYPCLVMPGTPLFEMWKQGKYTPYDSQKAAEVIARCKEFVPAYCRVMRVDRDIPTTLVASGVKHSNLREMVMNECKKLGVKCKCIRCREVGLSTRGRSGDGKLENKAKPNPAGAELKRIDYKASEGEEVFLSFEDDNYLYGFIRLRKPSKEKLAEIGKVAGVRELHVYGEQVLIGQKGEEKSSSQHKGLGTKLVREAERIAREEWKMNELHILSGIGAREYYRGLGYKLKKEYMIKKIK